MVLYPFLALVPAKRNKINARIEFTNNLEGYEGVTAQCQNCTTAPPLLGLRVSQNRSSSTKIYAQAEIGALIVSRDGHGLRYALWYV